MDGPWRGQLCINISLSQKHFFDKRSFQILNILWTPKMLVLVYLVNVCIFSMIMITHLHSLTLILFWYYSEKVELQKRKMTRWELFYNIFKFCIWCKYQFPTFYLQILLAKKLNWLNIKGIWYKIIHAHYPHKPSRHYRYSRGAEWLSPVITEFSIFIEPSS